MKTTERVEKKQSKHRIGREKRPLGRKYLQLDLRPIGEGERLSLLLEELGFSGAITAGNLPELSGGTLFCSRRVFWVKPNKDASMNGPTACVRVTGFVFVFF